MTRYVIGPDVAMRLAHEQAPIRDEHQVLAPTLLRSQLLSLLYQAVHRGEMTKKEAEQRLDYVRGLRIRLLGDSVGECPPMFNAPSDYWPALPRPDSTARRTITGVTAAKYLHHRHGFLLRRAINPISGAANNADKDSEPTTLPNPSALSGGPA